MMSPVEEIMVNLEAKSYPIFIGPDLLKAADTYLVDYISDRQVIVICDNIIGPLYQGSITKIIAPICARLDNLRIPAGEASKSLSVYNKLCEEILNIGIDRKTILIAMGGGVVGDLVGFVAASLLRGIDFIQIPTSLLAQVDSSVGGKTGINATAGKNLIGAFHQPKLVLADTNLLKTLPKRELLAGYAEIVKYGLVGDANFFSWLEENWSNVLSLTQEEIVFAVRRSCEMKADIIAKDEKETDMRALLNLGHTFAHAFEAVGKYNGDLLHGEAVAAGLGLAFDFSVAKQICKPEDALRVHAHLTEVGLPDDYNSLPAGKANVSTLIEHMRKDKKAAAGNLTFILIRKIGKACITPNISENELSTFFIAKGVNHD